MMKWVTKSKRNNSWHALRKHQKDILRPMPENGGLMEEGLIFLSYIVTLEDNVRNRNGRGELVNIWNITCRITYLLYRQTYDMEDNTEQDRVCWHLAQEPVRSYFAHGYAGVLNICMKKISGMLKSCAKAGILISCAWTWKQVHINCYNF